MTETLKNRLLFSPGLIKLWPGIYNLYLTDMKLKQGYVPFGDEVLVLVMNIKRTEE